MKKNENKEYWIIILSFYWRIKIKKESCGIDNINKNKLPGIKWIIIGGITYTYDQGCNDLKTKLITMQLKQFLLSF